jgi:Zn-dependent protease with chaperone function
MIGIGWGVYLYAMHMVPPTLRVPGRGAFLLLVVHAAVLLAGATILFSLVSAVFSFRRPVPEGKLLDAGAYPVLHCFVRALCTLINAPQPAEIRLEAVPNAAAARYGGLFGVGGRLVLVIGEPLFLGLDLRGLAGVIAHELGHFSQATSGLLFRFIATVSDWFARATHRTGAIQDVIGEPGEESGGSAQIFVLVMFCVTGLGRLILFQFALLSRIVTFHLLRQMEFDADRYEAEVAGSAQFARTCERLSELQVGFERVVKSLLRGEISCGPNASLPSMAVEQADDLTDRDRRRVAKLMSPQRARWFDSHPSPTERIAAVARQTRPGIFRLPGPAVCLIARKAP